MYFILKCGENSLKYSQRKLWTLYFKQGLYFLGYLGEYKFFLEILIWWLFLDNLIFITINKWGLLSLVDQKQYLQITRLV